MRWATAIVYLGATQLGNSLTYFVMHPLASGSRLDYDMLDMESILFRSSWSEWNLLIFGTGERSSVQIVIQ
jgi:hypothetical protein